MSDPKEKYILNVRSVIDLVKNGTLSVLEAKDKLKNYLFLHQNYEQLTNPPPEHNLFLSTVERWGKLENHHIEAHHQEKPHHEALNAILLAFGGMLAGGFLDLATAFLRIRSLDDAEEMSTELEGLRNALPLFLRDANQDYDVSVLGDGMWNKLLEGWKIVQSDDHPYEYMTDIDDRSKFIGYDLNAQLIQHTYNQLVPLDIPDVISLQKFIDKQLQGFTKESLAEHPLVIQTADNALKTGKGFGYYCARSNTGYLEKFPIDELFRAEDRIEPRDWPKIWDEHGGTIYAVGGGDYPEGRMAARPDDDIWEEISEFGQPWPPYRYGSGMSRRPVPRLTAESWGAIKAGERFAYDPVGLNDNYKVSLTQFSPKIRTQLLEDLDFKDQGDYGIPDQSIENMGGHGSGNWGHSGRKGKKGGSAPRSHGPYKLDPIPSHQDWTEEEYEQPGYSHQSSVEDDWESWKQAHLPHTPYQPYVPLPKWTSAGGVVFNDEGKIAIVKPKNKFGGYEYTLPKGKVEAGESHEDAAKREVGEEAGLQGDIIHDLGTHEGTQSHTHFFLMKHTGSSPLKDKEMDEVEFMAPEDAAEHLDSVRDLRVLAKSLVHIHKHLAEPKPKDDELPNMEWDDSDGEIYNSEILNVLQAVMDGDEKTLNKFNNAANQMKNWGYFDDKPDIIFEVNG